MAILVPEITPSELMKKMSGKDSFTLLDVRTYEEYEIANIRGVLIPLDELEERLEELDPSKELVVHCHHGGRSARAVSFLLQKGFTNVKNLKGGIDLWSQEIDTRIPRY